MYKRQDGDFPTSDYLNSEQNDPHYCTALCSTVGGLPVDVKLESEFILMCRVGALSPVQH